MFPKEPFKREKVVFVVGGAVHGITLLGTTGYQVRYRTCYCIIYCVHGTVLHVMATRAGQ